MKLDIADPIEENPTVSVSKSRDGTIILEQGEDTVEVSAEQAEAIVEAIAKIKG